MAERQIGKQTTTKNKEQQKSRLYEVRKSNEIYCERMRAKKVRSTVAASSAG
jgi:hypothetical protein